MYNLQKPRIVAKADLGAGGVHLREGAMGMANELDPRLLTGRLLLQEGLLSEEQLRNVVCLQVGHRALRWPGKSLGHHLVNSNLVAAAVLDRLLQARDARRARREEVRLGEMAVKNGLLSRAKLMACLAEQDAERLRTGEAPPLGRIIRREALMWEHDLQALIDRQAALLAALESAATDAA